MPLPGKGHKENLVPNVFSWYKCSIGAARVCQCFVEWSMVD